MTTKNGTEATESHQSDRPANAPASEYQVGLLGRGFLSLITAQFCGAANDNVLKQVLMLMVSTGIWANNLGRNGLGEGGQSIVGLCLTMPFIFLSGYAGQISDRFSKRNVILGVKIAEIPIAIVAMIGIFARDMWITIGALVLLAVQSSFFGPAKFGSVPELVREKSLSRANGWLNMLTNLAVIMGSLAAGPLCTFYAVKNPGVANRLAPGLTLLFVALLGLACALPMPKLRPRQPDLKFDWHPFRVYFKALREMSEGPLLMIALAWAGFYMVGWMALLIVPEYEAIIADFGFTDVSILMGILGVAIAVGSVTTGYVSGNHIRPQLVPFGALGMTVCFALLGTLTPTPMNVRVLVFMTGFSAGFYIIPLQALLQLLPPDDERGRFLATASALSFAFTSLGSAVYWVAANPLNIAPNRIHLICAGLAAFGSVIGIIKMKKLLASRDVGEETAKAAEMADGL